MSTEKLIRVEKLPEHLKKMIIQNLKDDKKRMPSHVMLEMDGDTVHGYRPIYMIEIDENTPLPSTDRRTRRRRSK